MPFRNILLKSTPEDPGGVFNVPFPLPERIY